MDDGRTDGLIRRNHELIDQADKLRADTREKFLRTRELRDRLHATRIELKGRKRGLYQERRRQYLP